MFASTVNSASSSRCVVGCRWQWCSRQGIGGVQFFSWYVRYLIREPVHTKVKPKDPCQKAIQLFAREEGYQRLVVCLDLDCLAQYVVGKLLTCPGDCQRLFFYLGVSALGVSH